MKKRIFTLVFFASLFCSCEKFLDRKSNDTLVTPQTLRDFQGLLDDAVTMNIRTTPSYMESCSDDFFIPDNIYTGLSEYFRTLYRWEATPYNYANDWSLAYRAVYNSNLCLEGLETVERTPGNAAEWDNAKGSALFFRSFYYSNLLFTYAKAYDVVTAQTDYGIVLREGSDFNRPSVRSSVADGYGQVLSDLKLALPLLPKLPLHKLRPSKAAAYALLSRVYMSMRNYPEAKLYADSALQIQNTLIDYNSDPDLSGSVSATVPFKAFNKETIFYTELSTGFNLHGTSRGRIDTLLYASYNGNDLRKTGFFRASSGLQIFKGNYTGSGSNNFSGLAVDEVLLNRSECYAREGKVAQAMADLNTLMRKRWKNTVTYPAFTAANDAEALQKILTERRKELLMRGLRWMDIKRLNKEGAGIRLVRFADKVRYELEPNSPRYALPLPADLINLTGMPQN